jgi:hypothetical protein
LTTLRALMGLLGSGSCSHRGDVPVDREPQPLPPCTSTTAPNAAP